MSTGTRRKGRPTPRATTRPAETGTETTNVAEPVVRPVATPGRDQPRRRSRSARRGLSGGAKAGLVVAAAIAVLGLIFAFNNRGGTTAAGRQGGRYPYQVGQPGPGQPAPPIRLPAATGEPFDLGALRGQTVLLYFQEGVGCQPCWDQLRDIEARWGEFEALGIDRIVTITGDPREALRRKVALEKLTTPVLSDAGLAVSKAYQANQYGMMGNSADGHSFIVVDKDGRLAWRADYGGAPKYTMYLPVPDLLADLRDGLAGTAR